MISRTNRHDPTPMGRVHAIQERLHRFYTKYAPERLVNVERLAPTIVGHEDETFAKLVEKYGPEPLEVGTRERLIRFYEHYAPQKRGEIDRLLPMFAGKENAMFAHLVEKYGPEPRMPSALETRERLARFYERYAPEKLDGVDRLLGMIEGQEEETFEKLIAKYGPEPEVSVSPAAHQNLPNAVEPSPSLVRTRVRLVRFYERYAPEKLDGVDRLLGMIEGQEEEAFEKLVAKYGPEPAVLTGNEPGLQSDCVNPTGVALAVASAALSRAPSEACCLQKDHEEVEVVEPRGDHTATYLAPELECNAIVAAASDDGSGERPTVSTPKLPSGFSSLCSTSSRQQCDDVVVDANPSNRCATEEGVHTPVTSTSTTPLSSAHSDLGALPCEMTSCRCSPCTPAGDASSASSPAARTSTPKSIDSDRCAGEDIAVGSSGYPGNEASNHCQSQGNEAKANDDVFEQTNDEGMAVLIRGAEHNPSIAPVVTASGPAEPATDALDAIDEQWRAFVSQTLGARSVSPKGKSIVNESDHSEKVAPNPLADSASVLSAVGRAFIVRKHLLAASFASHLAQSENRTDVQLSLLRNHRDVHAAAERTVARTLRVRANQHQKLVHKERLMIQREVQQRRLACHRQKANIAAREQEVHDALRNDLLLLEQRRRALRVAHAEVQEHHMNCEQLHNMLRRHTKNLQRHASAVAALVSCAGEDDELC